MYNNTTNTGVLLLQVTLALGIIFAFGLLAYYAGMFDAIIAEWQTLYYNMSQTLAVLP